MNRLLKTKKGYIALLQKYNGWGRDDEDTKSLFDVLEVLDSDLNSEQQTHQTNILTSTNKIISPIQLDNSIELPIVELFIDGENFVVFTTECIYNCRNASLQKLDYINIIGIDENSLNDFFRYKSKNKRFYDIKLITSNGNIMPITFEFGVSFRPIVYFLSIINDKKSN
jgi:hypothetical protein